MLYRLLKIKKFFLSCFSLLVAGTTLSCVSPTPQPQPQQELNFIPRPVIVYPQEISRDDARFLRPIAGLSNASCGLNGDSGIEEEVLRRINEMRGQGRFCGTDYYPATTPLSWNLALLRAAQVHSLQMAQANLVSHISVDARELLERVLPTGYPFAGVGENIAAGQMAVDAAMKSWENSPPHCANLMNPIYKDVAVACIYNKTSFYRFYWTMDLGMQREPEVKIVKEVLKEKPTPRREAFRGEIDPHDLKR